MTLNLLLSLILTTQLLTLCLVLIQLLRKSSDNRQRLVTTKSPDELGSSQFESELGQFRPSTIGCGPPSGPTRDELEWARELGAESEDEVKDLIERGFNG